MSVVYPKWRELDIDPKIIPLKKVQIDKIISYPPAGNDVIEFEFNNKNYFLKIERSKMADFNTEIKHLKYVKKFYKKIPNIIEHGIYENKHYSVLSKINGKRLSDIVFECNIIENLEKYGAELALIHTIPINDIKVAKQRIINDTVPDNIYPNRDEYINEVIMYLKNNHPVIKHDTFIHGDFHYANVIWENNEINGILDFEYSGCGCKEQDIAWAVVLRNTQKFLYTIEEINAFLYGYRRNVDLDYSVFKWCYINSAVHFYLSNFNDEEYKNRLRNIINSFMLENNKF